MKRILGLILTSIVSSCAIAPLRPAEVDQVARRLGIPSGSVVLVQGCAYALAFVGDKDASFTSGAPCLVGADRFVIFRNGETDASTSAPVTLLYSDFDGISLVKYGKNIQYQIKKGPEIFAMQMAKGIMVDLGAQRQAFNSAQRAGIPVFEGNYILSRAANPTIIPIVIPK